MRTQLWRGVYWDERGFERECILVTIKGSRILSGIDRVTREPIPDPPSAIPVSPVEPEDNEPR